MYELRMYAVYKRIECDKEKARNYYFYSFVGTIIYGHGRLQNVNKLSAKLVSLLSDAAFLGICEKLILILVCNPAAAADDTDSNFVSYLALDEQHTQCWSGKHQHYAAVSLLLIGYYIPLSTMIAPMFDEVPGQDDEGENEAEDDAEKNEEEKSKLKQFLALENCVDFVRPFISAVTVTKCFMLISATFLFKGGVYGTIVCDSIACLALLFFTLHWSFDNLQRYGLTQNEPGFPFGVSLIRSLGFFASIVGCIVETLKAAKVIDTTLDFILLFSFIFIATLVLIVVLWKYHSKFNQFDDDVDVNLLLHYNRDTKQIEVVSPTSSKNISD
uniref:Uncharacterized protein n=1 Tax=Elphidium margaritaceum TaxID=933848 RepID=A0A7S0XMZ2_9EUKA